MMRRHSWPLLMCLLAACAQVRDPQGGPKDEKPPILEEAVPPSGSINFTSDHILLHFNERVTLDRVREKLFISPPLAKTPDVSVVRGTDVVIALKAPLLPNTTYTFNIGDAIADLSEGNHALGLNYVMATGDHIDSLAILGMAEDAFTGQPAAGVLVLLHDANDTTTVRTGMPSYFARSDADGRFVLTHLRGGRFHLTALRDQNANYLYDLPNEDVAFIDSTVQAGDTVSQRLALFREPPVQQQLMEARVVPDRGWRLVLARPSGALGLRSLDREGGSLRWWPEWNATRDTVMLWPSDTTLLPEQRFELREDGAVLDTITYRPVTKMPFYVGLTLGVDTTLDVHTLVASRPLSAVDTSRIHFRRGTTFVPLTAMLDTATPRVLRLIDHSKGIDKGELELLPGAVKDLIGAGNDTVRLAIGETNASSFGELRVTVKTDSTARPPGATVLQLLDATGKVARELRSNAWPLAIDWRNVVPGAYSLRLIEDRDGNGRWSSGSFRAHRQPEKTLRYSAPVNVRAGWTVEITWILLP